MGVSPSEVFQPGSNKLNEMYIERPELESELKDAIRTDQATLLIGGSGSGKSWLYKRCFEDLKAISVVVSVSPNYTETLEAEFDKELGKLGEKRAVGYEHTRGFSIFGKIFGLNSQKSEKTEERNEDLLLNLAQAMRKKAGKRPAFLVVENAEQGLTNSAFLTDLSNVVMSANEAPFASTEVKILIVTADDSLRRELTRRPNSEPVMRRLRALEEVGSFSAEQALQFLRRGFEEKLTMRVSDFDELVEACRFATDLRPDYMHGFCLEVARAAQNQKGVVDGGAIVIAQRKWANNKLKSYVDRVVAFMNQSDTKKRVRDKVLYALAEQPGAHEFIAVNVLELVRDSYPSYKFQLGEVSQALNNLSDRKSGRAEPLLKRGGEENNPTYSFRGPTERLAVLFTLQKDGEKISRRRY